MTKFAAYLVRNHASAGVSSSCQQSFCRSVQVASGRAAELRTTIAPYFLRREKGSVQRIRAGWVCTFTSGSINMAAA